MPLIGPSTRRRLLRLPLVTAALVGTAAVVLIVPIRPSSGSCVRSASSTPP
jgi:hypothetical protein